MIILIFTVSPILVSLKGWENVLFELGSEGLSKIQWRVFSKKYLEKQTLHKAFYIDWD